MENFQKRNHRDSNENWHQQQCRETNWIELLQKFIAVESHSVQGGSRSHQKIRSQHYWKLPPSILRSQSPFNLNFSGFFLQPENYGVTWTFLYSKYNYTPEFNLKIIPDFINMKCRNNFSYFEKFCLWLQI